MFYVSSAITSAYETNFFLLIIFLVTSFFAGAGSLLLLTWTRNFYLNVFLFKFLTVSASCCTVLYTISSDLFPTQFKYVYIFLSKLTNIIYYPFIFMCRSMAISIVSLLGRVGAMVGSNFFGPMLFNYCTVSINIFACIIICCSVAAKYTLTRLEQHNKN